MTSQKIPMSYGKTPGLDKDISRIVMGSLFKTDFELASVLYDNFFELGGNSFDTARQYEGAEEVLGKWINNNRIREHSVIIAKGAHTPGCYPENVTKELFTSLEKLQTDYVDIYFLHRDNESIPVGEFIDVLNEHKSAGRIRCFGGSNWTLKRIDEANEYAKSKGITGFTSLSNNLSLAHMVKAPFEGCLSVSDDTSKAWLRKNQISLFPWSSQAQGFFTNSEHTVEFRNNNTYPDSWNSPENFERKNRAVTLSKNKNVSPTTIALAFVLSQSFPTFPIIGPFSTEEIASSLTSITLKLSAKELDWLNLKSEDYK